MNLLKTLGMAVLLTVIALPLSASVIFNVDNTTTFSLLGTATTVTFDDTLTIPPSGGVYSDGFAKYSWTGANPFVQGSVGGAYAAPPSDSTPYLSVGSPGLAEPVTIDFLAPIVYFGFYLGSPDTYNHIDFYSGGNSIGSFTGAQLIAPGNGDQSLGGYVNFYASNDGVSGCGNVAGCGAPITQIKLSSEHRAAFETDNHAYAQATPEPGTLCTLLGGCLILLGSTKRIKRLF